MEQMRIKDSEEKKVNKQVLKVDEDDRINMNMGTFFGILSSPFKRPMGSLMHSK